MSIYQRILVPIDGSETAARGLDEAIALARAAGCSLRLLHVVDDLVFVTGFEPGTTYLKDVLPKLRRSGEEVLAAARERVVAAGVPVDTLLLECFARRTAEIVIEQAKAWPADLIVLGTHGRRGFSRALLGSDAEEIVRSAPVPVLLVHAVESDTDARTSNASAVPAARAAAAATS
jgi:Universal stress protein UspA and related nucleotide-binding proteins